MPTANNSFSKGLSFDINKLNISDEVYIEAENFRLQSKDGDLIAITNTKGTEIRLTIPNTRQIYKLNFEDVATAFAIPITTTLTLFTIDQNNVPLTPYPFNYTFRADITPESFTADMKADSTISNLINQGHFDIQFNKQYVLIVGFDWTASIGGFPTGITDTLHIPSQTGLNIIGIIPIRNHIVLITTNNKTKPDKDTWDITSNIQSVGQIWICEFDENTNTILGLDINGFLVPSIHLRYNEYLNLTSWCRVSGEGRYEWIEGQKIYFTDYFNNLRFFNVAKDNPFATPPEIIQVNPLNNKTVPVITNIQDGGFIPNGAIQYFYQLTTDDGLQTFFSNPSDLMFTTSSNLNSSFQNYQGGTIGQSSGKSITIRIDNLDLRYNIIKIGYILYETKDNPIVRLFFEGDVNTTGSIEVTHSYRAETEITLSLADYTNLFGSFEVCKGLETKKNILLAYNTKDRPFDLKLDCRAYRFRNDGTIIFANAYQLNEHGPKTLINAADPYTLTDLDYFSSVGSWLDIAETDDNINAYNFEDPQLNAYDRTPGMDWFTQSQFKFQLDGTTLGGSGPLISYRFITSPQETGDITGNPSLPQYPFVKDSPNIGATQFSTMKNVYHSSTHYGYANGEVYRHGIVFFGLSYQHSFVQWIGDIKFPHTLEQQVSDPNEFELAGNYDRNTNIGYPNGERIFQRQIGIEFTLDTSTPEFQAVKDQITGWAYVRMERTSKDKTRLGVGLINTLKLSPLAIGDAGYDFYVNSGILPPFAATSSFINYTDSGATLSTEAFTFDNPNFAFDLDNSYTSSDYLKIINFTETGTYNFLSNHIFSAGPFSLIEKQEIMRTYIFPNNNSRRHITKSWNVPVPTNQNFVPAEAPFLLKNFADIANGNNSGYSSIGNKTTLLSFGGTSDIPLYSPVLLQYRDGSGLPFLPANVNTKYIFDGDGRIKIVVSYERYLTNQYGGPAYINRLGQDYIYISETVLFDPINNQVIPTPINPNPLITFSEGTTVSGGFAITKCFGGDTYKMVYDQTKLEKNWESNPGQVVVSGWPEASTNIKVLVGQVFPSEVSANIHLRQGYHFANKQYLPPSGAYDNGTHLHDEFILNSAYNQQNNSKKFFSIPFNYNPINEKPHRIWASQVKYDGEFLEAWMVFKPNDNIDVEGTYGPIERMIIFNDRVIGYQWKGIFTVDILEKQVVGGNGDATATTIGTGTVLARYDYVSKTTGVQHQFAVVKTPNGVYHFDISIRKAQRFTDSLQPLTDIKGISTWANKNLLYDIKNLDYTTRPFPAGVHMGYDPRYNNVYFTFFDYHTDSGRDIVQTIPHTLTYNELLDCFESFNFTDNPKQPSQYFQTRTRMMSAPIHISYDNLNGNIPSLWEHNVGKYNEYFGTNQKSNFSIIVNAGVISKQDFTKLTKRFDIIELIVEGFLKDTDTYLPAEFFESIQISNDYQDTGQLPAANFVKRMKSWRINTLRGVPNAQGLEPRLKDKYIKITMIYNNPDNNKLLIHDIQTIFEPQPL